MFTWLKDLTPTESKTLRACFAGWALDALDVQVFSFVLPTLIAVWGITRQEAGSLGTVALLTSSVGGWLAGILSDRFGRVRVLQFTIAWYAFFTFLCGFAQNFEQFFIFRALQGIGFGGEWAAGSVLIAEVIRDKYRGRAGGFVQSGWAIGWGLAAIIYTILFSLVPQHQAWRWLFWIGVAPAVLVLYIRGHVDEPQVFKERKLKRSSDQPPLTAIFRPGLLGTTLKLCLLTTGCQGATYIYQVWLPTYLRTERGLSVIGTGGFTFALIVGAFFGFLIGAYLADSIGRRKTFFISALGSAVMLVVYMVLPITNQIMLPSGCLLGFFTYMVFAPLGAYLSEIYPTEIRGSGQGFCYNAGRGVGALFPLLIGILSVQIPLGKSIAAFGFVAYGLMLVALFMLPETLGRGLDHTSLGESDESITRGSRSQSRECSVTRPCLPSLKVVRSPRTKLPPNACDCHFHIFGDYAAFPLQMPRDYTPPAASTNDYLEMSSALGISRMVIVQPSVYGTDNSCTLNALAGFTNAQCRAVVVLDQTATTAELTSMSDAGVRGVRFNMVNSGGPSPIGLMEMARKVAPLGWHIQLYLKGPQLIELSPLLASLPTPVVIDHIAQITLDSPTYAAEVDALHRLTDRGSVWVKLCGYRASIQPYPYDDVAPLARSLVVAAPERCVWGTDWPHPGLDEAMPDDTDLLDLLESWTLSTAVRNRILVDNPASLYGF